MLRTRILAAAVMLPLAVLWVWLAPPPVFALVAATVLLVAAWEWGALCGLRGLPARGAWMVLLLILMILAWWTVRGRLGYAMPVLWLALAFWLAMLAGLSRDGLWNSRAGLLLQGIMALLPAFLALLLLRRMPGGIGLVFAVLVIVWSADVGAYFAGRAAGRHKLAPRLSPGKTWEGLWGGLVLAAVAGAVASLWCPVPLAVLMPVAIVTAGVSVVGDLVESRLKRRAGAKDSGRIIPGHGGILDRIDSLGAALPVFALGIELGRRLW